VWLLVEEEDSTYMADNYGASDEVRTLRPLQAAACTYPIALGARAGQKVMTLQGAMPRYADCKQPLCADISGFSLHAAVRCGADDRQALEQLCRYITRPALANERVQANAAGQVVLKLKTPWRMHQPMTPSGLSIRLVRCPVGVVQRRSGARCHRREADPQHERPGSRRSRWAVDDRGRVRTHECHASEARYAWSAAVRPC